MKNKKLNKHITIISAHIKNNSIVLFVLFIYIALLALQEQTQL